MRQKLYMLDALEVEFETAPETRGRDCLREDEMRKNHACRALMVDCAPLPPKKNVFGISTNTCAIYSVTNMSPVGQPHRCALAPRSLHSC